MSRTPCNCRICRERRESIAAAMTAPYGSQPTPERIRVVYHLCRTRPSLEGAVRYIDQNGELFMEPTGGERVSWGFKVDPADPLKYNDYKGIVLKVELPSSVYPVLVEYVGGSNAGSLRYLDSDGRLWLDRSCTGQRMNSGFKPTAARGQYRNSDRDVVRECVPAATKAEPEKRYAVQMGDGSGSGPGNSMRLFSTESSARLDARTKAEAHPGKKVLLLAVTEVEACLVTIQTKAVKSWE